MKITEQVAMFCLFFPTDLHGAFLVLLPLSVIIMVVGGVLGIVNLLARAHWLLVATGILLIFGGKAFITFATHTPLFLILTLLTHHPQV